MEELTSQIRENKSYPACEISLRIKTAKDTLLSNNNNENEEKESCDINIRNVYNKRIISIGDIHGSYVGLLEILYYANITTSIDKCEWKSQDLNINNNYSNNTLLVQVGDIVDRGPGATESQNCLKYLQSTASSFNSKVVRLLGSNNNNYHNDSYSLIFKN